MQIHAISNDDVEMTAGQRGDTGNRKGDEIETRGTGNLSYDARETRDSVNYVTRATLKSQNRVI